MLGMFMSLPVFELYARDLPGHVTPLQIGLAIGLYGLVQAYLQIPVGMLSDRIGRKPVIVVGLALFALGSIIAGHTQNNHRSEEHTSELQSLMRIAYTVFCFKQKRHTKHLTINYQSYIRIPISQCVTP